MVHFGLQGGPEPANPKESISTKSSIQKNEHDVLNSLHSTSIRLKRGTIEDQLSGIASPFLRVLALDNLLNRLATSELRELHLENENTKSSFLQMEIRRAIFRHLALIDPVGAISQIDSNWSPAVQSELIEVIFQEWSVSNLDEAIEQASLLSKRQRQEAFQGIQESRVDLSEHELFEIAKDVGVEQAFSDQIAISLLDETIENPCDQWNSQVLQYGSDFEQWNETQRQVLVHVAKTWIEREKISAYQAIASDLALRDSRVWLVSEVLKQLSSTNSDIVQSIAKDMMRSDYLGLVQVIETWARQDNNAVLELASWIDEENGDMRMQRAAIRAWAESKPNDVVSFVMDLPSDLRPWSLQTALLEMGKTTPSAVPELVDMVTNLRSKEIVVNNLALNWSKIDPFAALQWVFTDPVVNQLPGSPERKVLNAAVIASPQRALESALELPTNELGIGPEAIVIGEMADHDIDRAMDMLGNARNTKTSLSAHVSIGQRLIGQGRSEKVLALIEERSKEFQVSFFKSLAPSWARTASRDLHHRLKEMPTEEIKELCGLELLKHNANAPFLTVVEMQELSALVPEKRRDLLKHTVD